MDKFDASEILQPPKGADENEWRHYATRMFVQYQIRDVNSRIDYMVKTIAELSDGQKKMMELLQEMGKKNEAFMAHKSTVESAIEKHAKEIEAIANEMPEIKTVTGYVKRGVVGIVTMVGIALVTLVMK